jgi:proliferating cell nuclear antigen
MFQAQIKSEYLKQLLEIIRNLTNEVKFVITESTLTIKAVDTAHVAMVDLTLKSDGFEEFKASDCKLGIDLEKLNEVLKLAGGGDIISLEHDEDMNRLITKIGNITRRMSLLDASVLTDPKVPNLNLPVKIKLRAAELLQGIRASEPIADHISLIAQADMFELSSQGDTDSVSLKLPKDMLEELECSETVKSLFALDYFSKMIKAVGPQESVMMNLGSDYPVKLEFTFAENHGSATYLLAPRIESE